MSTGIATSQQKPPRIHRARHRFSYLLLSQFALIVGYPIFATDTPRHGLYGMFVIALFIAALYTIVGEGHLTVVGVVLGVPAIAGNLLASFGYLPNPFAPGLACAIIFMAFVTAVILWSVLSTASVTTETLYGAIAAYLLIGLTWGMAYFLLEHVSPGAFHYASEANRQIARPDFIFFSFVTLTTLGYGDILPVSGHAKAFAILEAVTGTMYPAVLIGRLIGLYSGKSRQL